MSFECAVFADDYRCQQKEAGDAVYLGGLTFCMEHQLLFEDLVQASVLSREIAGAKLNRYLGPIFQNPRPMTEPIKKDLRYEATVFLIRCEGYIKIGYAGSPHKRLKQLQATDGTKYPEGMNCSTAALIQTEPGGIDRERDLHQKFKHLRHTGEWFMEAKELTDYIEGLAA